MNKFRSPGLLVAVFSIACFAPLRAQTQPAIPAPDDRYKADILLIVAHPDDDTGASTYLAKAVLDEGKRAAVVFTTRGNSGPNAVGMEQSKALADVREMEARRSLAARGITNVWFLSGRDTATQDVLHSLENLGHGEALEEVVRIVRLTRPEVILTWLPAYVAGENHGDHQASSVVAVEAFDLAGNPAAFPEQITAPRDRKGISNYGEGLHPWQAKKIYFFSDASHPEFLKGHGPVYLATEVSPSKKTSYAEINRDAWKYYASQLDFNDEVLHYYTDMPEQLVLGKSLVAAATDADVMAGIDAKPIPFAGQPEYKPAARTGARLELGGPWAFYREFYRAHALASLEGLVPAQSALSSSHELWVPLVLSNDSASPADVTLHSVLPQGWSGEPGDAVYRLEPGATYPVQLFLRAPADSTYKTPPQRLEWTTLRDGVSIGKVGLTVYTEFDGVPQ